ncbi:cytochrome C oxidase, cbb3-type, subunit III [Longilinea arvoryzae]|uniref:Cytochrome C oxidase, cbb3-type, subunit III n=1 Tax=Longilinea arvoryzae TaxID=360412 RepID=A0A0S7BEZ7_9CHLR|nr:c-type cytochrome [Longilinea arvoryzae]GAP14057.1 cytochrome C oxidase, cbb3-type, subunit III [Longilinea arvoryzae]
MKRFSFYIVPALILLVLIVFLVITVRAQANAGPLPQTDETIIRGARLYDNWYALLETQPRAGDMPLWTTQTTNTRSGAETWRCVTCHGWDYQGKDGAFGSGSNYTGFPGVYQTQVSDLSGAITGRLDPQHDFSPYLSGEDVDALVAFIKNGTIDDNQFIDLVSRKVLNGDLANGKAKYENTCVKCHGEDGAAMVFRMEGQNVTLGTLAVTDPWRFLHRTRFGTAAAPDMPIGRSLGWSAQDGRDVLYYAQTFPSGLPSGKETPSLGGREATPVVQPGGPAQGFWGGLLTAFGAMATSLGFALLLGVVLVGLIFLLVWIARGKK